MHEACDYSREATTSSALTSTELTSKPKPNQLNVLTWRWMLVSFIAMVLLWGTYYLVTGRMPTGEGRSLVVSRAWDILGLPLLAAALFQGFRLINSDCVEIGGDNRYQVFASLGWAVGVSCGLIMGLLDGFAVGCILALIAGVILSVACSVFIALFDARVWRAVGRAFRAAGRWLVAEDTK